MPSSPIPERFPENFPGRLLAWWDQHGRKDLPWQNPRDAYRVWVSEIMLQQTQVVAVIPYFERWMERFPDLAALARAEQDEVLSLWSGLGYYARARNLHKAAAICMAQFGGNLPDSARTLKELPGIGQSTANAIVSLAYNRPAAILDGNVKRVLARHTGIEGWPGDAAVHKQLWQVAESRLPQKRAADYSQAMMDLGATVCTRRNPACGECPVSEDCQAKRLESTHRIPAPRPKKEVPEKTVHMLVIRDSRGRVLLQRRPPSGIWGGLWSLPEGETPKAARAQIGLSSSIESHSLPDFEHRLTHLRLRIRPRLMTWQPASGLECTELREDSDLAWCNAETLKSLGLPRPVSKILDAT